MKLLYQEAKEKLNRIILTESILVHLQDHLNRNLKEAAKKVGPIRVKLEDVNGPYAGGIDKECQMEVYLPFAQKKVQVKEISQSVHGAITLSAQKIGEKIQKYYEKWKKKGRKHSAQIFWSYASSLRV